METKLTPATQTAYGFVREGKLYGQIFPSVTMAETYIQVQELDDDWRLVELAIDIIDLSPGEERSSNS